MAAEAEAAREARAKVIAAEGEHKVWTFKIFQNHDWHFLIQGKPSFEACSRHNYWEPWSSAAEISPGNCWRDLNLTPYFQSDAESHRWWEQLDHYISRACRCHLTLPCTSDKPVTTIALSLKLRVIIILQAGTLSISIVRRFNWNLFEICAWHY